MGYLIKSNVIDALEEDMQDTMMCYEGTQEEDIVRFCYKCMQRVIADLPQYWPNNVFEDTGLTPEQIQELEERNTAKIVNLIPFDGCDDDSDITYKAYCPICKRYIGILFKKGYKGKGDNFCRNCGQRLKWEE